MFGVFFIWITSMMQILRHQKPKHSSFAWRWSWGNVALFQANYLTIGQLERKRGAWVLFPRSMWWVERSDLKVDSCSARAITTNYWITFNAFSYSMIQWFHHWLDVYKRWHVQTFTYCVIFRSKSEQPPEENNCLIWSMNQTSPTRVCNWFFC